MLGEIAISEYYDIYMSNVMLEEEVIKLLNKVSHYVYYKYTISDAYERRLLFNTIDVDLYIEECEGLFDKFYIKTIKFVFVENNLIHANIVFKHKVLELSMRDFKSLLEVSVKNFNMSTTTHTINTTICIADGIDMEVIDYYMLLMFRNCNLAKKTILKNNSSVYGCNFYYLDRLISNILIQEKPVLILINKTTELVHELSLAVNVLKGTRIVYITNLIMIGRYGDMRKTRLLKWLDDLKEILTDNISDVYVYFEIYDIRRNLFKQDTDLQEKLKDLEDLGVNIVSSEDFVKEILSTI